MQKLKKEEMPTILPIASKRSTLLRVTLLQLEIGEGLFLPRDEWKAKNSPRFIVVAITKSHGFRYEFGWKSDGTGWLFRRTA
jgi:hypothetical protein